MSFIPPHESWSVNRSADQRSVAQIRWLVLPFACVAAWYVGIFAGLLIGGAISSLVLRMAPIAQSTWAGFVGDGAFYFATGLSALSVVVTAYMVAPAAKLKLAWIAFFLGSIAAVATRAEWAWIASAIATGLLTVCALTLYSLLSHDRP